jgi:hypothetical protein
MLSRLSQMFPLCEFTSRLASRVSIKPMKVCSGFLYVAFLKLCEENHLLRLTPVRLSVGSATYKSAGLDNSELYAGISIVHTPNPHVTHHLTSTFVANDVIAASLLTACQFVKPEWLNEVIRLGNLPLQDESTIGTSLEQVFALPPTTKFRPSFSPSLPPPLKVFKAWEPNEERLNMFKGFRFLCVVEKGREINSDRRGVISRGGGSMERFDGGGGRAKWHKALSSASAKDGVKKLVVVADEGNMKTAVGKDTWQDLNDEAEKSFSSFVAPRTKPFVRFGLRFISPGNITKAVMNVDTSFIDSSTMMNVDVDDGSSRFSVVDIA